MWWRPRERRSVNLALQGGGAHGAFTWGVLDALLEDGRLEFDGLSGTSAGAMNAVVLAHGMLQDGRDGARAALATFWQAVADSLPLLHAGADDGDGTPAPGLRMAMYWTELLAPRQFNPLDINPLREIVAAQIDFGRLRTQSPLRLFVAATHANTGRLRLFRTAELTADSLLASACLPSLHHPVEIDDQPYWDGAFSANPAVFPLLYECAATDTLLVLLSPMDHGGTPHTVEDIRRRTRDLAFKSHFLHEMRLIAMARGYAGGAFLPVGRLERRLVRARLHLIAADALMNRLSVESKMTTSQRFLEMLRDQGRTYAGRWLSAHRADVGRRSSVDVQALFR